MEWIMISIRRKAKITIQLQGILIAVAAVLLQQCHVSGEACGQEELSNCAKPLQVLSSTSELSFVTKREDLDKLCPDLRIGVECIRSYTRRCMDINQRDHFNKLYEGTNEMVKDLCEDENYKEDFLRHTPCMHMIKKSYEKCATNYQETMNRIAEENNNPTTTTTTTTKSPWSSDLSNYVVLGRNTEVQQIKENKTALSPEQEYIKTICWNINK
uniref:CSON015365 protein n=1 Tax=Culicoides sonorensis TaxID=179676 RepID=A0A336MH10_CULSO